MDNSEIKLTESQKEAYEIVKSGKSCCYFGPPGAGKSFLINEIVKWAKQTRTTSVVIATTGAASSLIGGRTLHAWTGTGIESLFMHSPRFIDAMKNLDDKKKQRFKRTKLAICDEAGMLSHDQYRNLDIGLQEVTEEYNVPFGGIQTVFIGDPIQLPCVDPTEDFGTGRTKRIPARPMYMHLGDSVPVIVAKDLKRSKDPLLTQIILAIAQPDEKLALRALEIVNKVCFSGIKDELGWLKEAQKLGASIITFRKNRVTIYNETEKRMAEKIYGKSPALPKPQLLKNREHMLRVIGDDPEELEEELRYLRERNTFEEELCPHRDTLLMMRLNENDLVNGDILRFVSYDSHNDCVIAIRCKDNKEFHISRMEHRSEYYPEDIGYLAFPLIPCYAMTIHKAQGATMNKVIFDPTDIHCSQKHTANTIYVAISRVGCLKDLILTLPILSNNLEMHDVRQHILETWNYKRSPWMKHYPRSTMEQLEEAYKEYLAVNPSS